MGAPGRLAEQLRLPRLVTPNDPVWYPYSVSQIRFLVPNAPPTSASRRSRVAIVIVVQCPQPPENGVSRGLEGYGWWA